MRLKIDPACWARESCAAPRILGRAGVKVKPVYRKRKGEALQMACGVCARSTRRAASLPGEGSTHLRGCGMTAVDAVDGSSTGTGVPRMGLLLSSPLYGGANHAHDPDNRSGH